MLATTLLMAVGLLGAGPDDADLPPPRPAREGRDLFRDHPQGVPHAGAIEPDALMYPDARVVRQQAGSGGGAAPPLTMRSRQQVAATADDYAKVVAFYDKKWDAGRGGTGVRAAGKESVGMSVVEGRDRPFRMKLYVRYTPDSSTTVVVSRADGENTTTIDLVTNSHDAP